MNREGKNLSDFLKLKRIANNRFCLAEWARAHAPCDAEADEYNYKVEMALFRLLQSKTKGS